VTINAPLGHFPISGRSGAVLSPSVCVKRSCLRQGGTRAAGDCLRTGGDVESSRSKMAATAIRFSIRVGGQGGCDVRRPAFVEAPHGAGDLSSRDPVVNHRLAVRSARMRRKHRRAALHFSAAHTKTLAPTRRSPAAISNWQSTWSDGPHIVQFNQRRSRAESSERTFSQRRKEDPCPLQLKLATSQPTDRSRGRPRLLPPSNATQVTPGAKR
jgi:hypothetical protein